jgi:hypothetical protein
MTAAMLRDHFPLMVLHAFLLSSFLALLWRDTARERARFFARTFLLLVGGVFAAGWLMAPVPRR